MARSWQIKTVREGLQNMEVEMARILKQTVFLLLISLSTSTYAFWFKIPKNNQTIIDLGVSFKEDFTGNALDPDSIKVLVWNAYKGSKEEFPYDFFRLSKDRDLLILQEAFLKGKMKQIFEENTDFDLLMATSFIYRKSGNETGVLTGAKVSPMNIKYLRSKNREFFGGTPKMVLVTTYPIAGTDKTLMSVNIHGLNSVRWKTLARQVLDAMKYVKRHRGPVIFAGDFNTWSKRKYKFVMRSMKMAGLKEVHFPNGDKRMKVFGRVLDHIFVKDLMVTTSKIDTEAKGSDHPPLLATFSYSPATN